MNAVEISRVPAARPTVVDHGFLWRWWTVTEKVYNPVFRRYETITRNECAAEPIR